MKPHLTTILVAAVDIFAGTACVVMGFGDGRHWFTALAFANSILLFTGAIFLIIGMAGQLHNEAIDPEPELNHE